MDGNKGHPLVQRSLALKQGNEVPNPLMKLKTIAAVRQTLPLQPPKPAGEQIKATSLSHTGKPLSAPTVVPKPIQAAPKPAQVAVKPLTPSALPAAAAKPVTQVIPKPATKPTAMPHQRSITPKPVTPSFKPVTAKPLLPPAKPIPQVKAVVKPAAPKMTAIELYKARIADQKKTTPSQKAIVTKPQVAVVRVKRNPAVLTPAAVIQPYPRSWKTDPIVYPSSARPFDCRM